MVRARVVFATALSFACFAFNGIQSVFTAYFVTYLAALGYELAAAGFLETEIYGNPFFRYGIRCPQP